MISQRVKGCGDGSTSVHKLVKRRLHVQGDNQLSPGDKECISVVKNWCNHPFPPVKLLCVPTWEATQ